MERHVWTYEEYLLESNLTDHAECELRRAGLFDDDSDYNGMIGKAVMALIKVFAEQGHSGFSAPMVVQLFTKVANYDTLTPITSDPEEWTDIADMCDGEKLWQNKRCSRMFSNDGGKTWWDVDEKGVHDLQEAKRAVRQIYDGACVRLGIPNDLKTQNIDLADVDKHA